MTHSDIKQIFGTYSSCGRAIGVSRQCVWALPDPIPTPYADRILGACIRLGINIPVDVLAKKSA